jgi:hypothetical protein
MQPALLAKHSASAGQNTLRCTRDLRRTDSTPLDRMATIRYIRLNIANDNHQVRCATLDEALSLSGDDRRRHYPKHLRGLESY